MQKFIFMTSNFTILHFQGPFSSFNSKCIDNIDIRHMLNLSSNNLTLTRVFYTVSKIIDILSKTYKKIKVCTSNFTKIYVPK